MRESGTGLTAVGPEGLEAERERLCALYRACFTEPPWSESEAQLDAFADRLSAHLAQPGVRGAVALDGDGALLGASYGWQEPDPLSDSPFNASLAAAVSDCLGPGAVSEHLAGAFVVVELMVDPGARRRGLARRLLRAVVGDGSRAWLCTSPASGATQLYLTEGWTPLAEFNSPAGPRLAVYVAQR